MINSGQDSVIKTLGISWISTENLFTVTASPISPDFLTTKRNVLRKVATIFDPLGYVIVTKSLLQKLWMRVYDWDGELQHEIANKIGDWFKHLKILKEVKIPYPVSSWFLLRQTREKPLRATVRSFEVTAIQRH